MKGTARALFTVATPHRMCYETICDHVHNRVDRVHNSADHVYNRGNHMHNLVLQTETAGETRVIITKAAKNYAQTHRQPSLYIFR